MTASSLDVSERDLINAKYRQKIVAFADRRSDLSESEAEQQFLICCRRATEWCETAPPTPFLRQVAWRWLTEGPHAARQYANRSAV